MKQMLYALTKVSLLMNSHHVLIIRAIKIAVLIAAFLGDHKLNGFKEILNFRSKTERIDEIVEDPL